MILCLNWDKQLASSAIRFHSVCQLFHRRTALATLLFKLLSAGLIFGPCCWISLFSGTKQNLWCQLRNPFTSMKLALVFKEIILIYVILFWPGSIMICLYVVFFNYPSVRAGSRTKLNWKTGWHNTMQTSYQLIFTSCRNVDPYGHGLHIALYLHVIQSWSINFRTWMCKTRSVYLDPRSTYCIIIEQMSFILPFMHLAVVLRKVFLLINQCSLFSVLGSPRWFAPAIHANLDPVRKTFQSIELQKKTLAVPLASRCHAKAHI